MSSHTLTFASSPARKAAATFYGNLFNAQTQMKHDEDVAVAQESWHSELRDVEMRRMWIVGRAWECIGRKIMEKCREKLLVGAMGNSEGETK